MSVSAAFETWFSRAYAAPPSRDGTFTPRKPRYFPTWVDNEFEIYKAGYNAGRRSVQQKEGPPK